MYNYFLVIGRVASDVTRRVLEDNRVVLSILVAVQRPFRNSQGAYDTDFLRVTLWEATAEIVADNVRKGALIGVKGRLVSKKETLENNQNIYTTELVGDRVVFFNNVDTKDAKGEE